ncbi:MAG TPA: hypothetical protein DCZ94_09020 [Lentisphaeria bacterium]|nr:MAG: hypothetical protein A2X48_23385 [Lentisphaerae bacterium GWF2_49_21]HBC87081.1 hypothetical protein [Lentisphaeria bacterium]
MPIPVFNAGQGEPDAPSYIVGKDGFYLKKRTPLYECTVKVPELPDYPEVKENVNWTATKLPWALIESTLEFFRAVYMKYQGEAIVLITHDSGIWDISVPKQIVQSAHLKYKSVDKVTPAGTIHSHCNMGAFFSGTDDNDVASFDGLHIVLGRISQPFPEIASAVYINGRMFECRPQDIISDMPGHTNGKAKRHPWLKHVKPAEKEFPFNEHDHELDFPGRDAEFGNRIIEMEEF